MLRNFVLFLFTSNELFDYNSVGQCQAGKFVKVEKTLFKKVCVIHEEIYVF